MNSDVLFLGYAYWHLDQDCLEQLTKQIDFSSLVRDEYLVSSLRCRRYSRFYMSDSDVRLMQHEDFSQEDTPNYKRQQNRVFSPLVQAAQPIETWSALARLLLVLRQMVGSPAIEAGVHAIRTTAVQARPGIPSPEGLHSDGFDYVAIVVCSAPHAGAETVLVSVADARGLEFGSLPAGGVLVFNDKSFLHCTRPFYAHASEQLDRDVLVVTLRAVPS